MRHPLLTFFRSQRAARLALYGAALCVIAAGFSPIAFARISNPPDLPIDGKIVVDGSPYPKTSVGINSAISACWSFFPLCTEVELVSGTFTMTTRVTPKNQIKVQGAGEDSTILLGGVAFDYQFYYSSSTAPLLNFSLNDLTIDLNFTTAGSGVRYDNSSSTMANRVTFKNGASSGWFMVLGAPNGATDGVMNHDTKLIDVTFDTHLGTLEALLVFNAENTQVIRPKLKNITSPGIGLWQKAYDTMIENLHCEDSTGAAIYYSITVDRTTIDNPKFDNCRTGVQGANISDNGAFGFSQAKDLFITNPIFTGGSNSTSSTAIQLGAVDNADISGGSVAGYQIAVLIDDGNNSASSSPTNWSIRGMKLHDNNRSADVHALHPAILMGMGSNSGSCINGTISGNQIYYGSSLNQRYPIVMDGAHTFDCLDISVNRLTAATSSGGTSIGLFDSAVLGPNVKIYNNADYSGSNPPQTYTVYNSSIGVGTSTPQTALDVNGLIRTYQTATTSCSSLIEGAIFFNATAGNKHFYGCDGTSWKQLD